MKDESSLELRRQRANRKAMIIAVQVVIVLALVAAVTAGIWDQAQQPEEAKTGMGAAGASSQAAGIPAQIGGLRRAQTMTGKQAMAELKELHGKDVGGGLVRGWIAHYGKEATIWFGEASDENTAVQLLDAMTSRIKAGNRVFQNLQELQLGGRQVYSVTGQGQTHYYYRQDRAVIWIAAPPGREEQFLKEALPVINS